MTTKSAEPAKPGIEWGPTIAAACDGCRTCIDFCHNDVFGWADDTAFVAHKTDCVASCSHCATLREAGAISFPTTEDLRRARRGG